MSKALYADGSIYVSTYAGPERTDGGPRKRVQITDMSPVTGPSHGLALVTLSMEQWSHLYAAVLQLGPECDGPEL